MLESVRCINFRKHADLTVHFTPGINTVRAAVEAGKSTLLEAIAYAYYGAAALKESIEDVVTYDVPVNQLRVELEFRHADVAYSIVRSPKGAELRAQGVTVTGQKEVTKYVEGLFGASQAMASKLMMARQKDLGGALTEGATAAGKMIEDLADLGLIEQLVGLVGEKLPAGNTAAALGIIETLRVQTGGELLPEPVVARQAAETALQAVGAAERTYNKAKDDLDELDVDAAKSILADEARLQQDIADRLTQISQTEARHAVALPVAPTEVEIVVARAKVDAQASVAAAEKIHNELKAARVESLWEGDFASLQEAVVGAKETLAAVGQRVAAASTALQSEREKLTKIGAEARVTIAQLEGKLIKEETCAFCDKDLKDVPQVVLINNPLTAQITKLREDTRLAETACSDEIKVLQKKLTDAQTDQKNCTDDLADMERVVARRNQLEPLYARAEAYVTFDCTQVPALWTWTGPEAADETDYAGQLSKLETDARTAVAAAATRASEVAYLSEVRISLKNAQEKLAALEIKDATETLTLADTLKPQVSQALASWQAAQDTSTRAAAALHSLEVERRLQAEGLEKAKTALAQAETNLAEMEANNALIKKLRAARPVITDKLWAIVLAAVTTYFSDVRGERSVITRADGKFRVNGKPVSGLSGSAEDVLGLANRFALTKTFLPGIDWVMLDEPAAACNEERELAVLGLLATSGFAQTLLVTHSDLADAFSDNIITI